MCVCVCVYISVVLFAILLIVDHKCYNIDICVVYHKIFNIHKLLRI